PPYYIFCSLPAVGPTALHLFPYTPLFRSLQRLTHHVNLGHEVTNVGNRESEMVATLSVASTREKTLVLSRQFSDQLFLRCHLRRSEEHTSELQSRENLVCRLLLEKKNIIE